MKKQKHPSLYPDILFHFTSKEGLFKILEYTFKVSYAREKIEGKNTKRELAVPMVSFCDLKLSELKVHMSKYGSYGIGLTKDWANRKGLNPVMYVNRHCEFTDNFNNALYTIYPYLSNIRKNLKNNDALQEIPHDMKILDAYRYMKNYEGTLIRDGHQDEENFRFADEREWRYVPSLNDYRVEEPFVAISNIETKKQKMEYNQKIENIKLDFDPNDIKYLIVEDDNEINGLIEHIQKVKKFHSIDVISRLSSRILTKEQIDKDI